MSTKEENKSSAHEVIICSACSKPLFSFNSILSDKIDVWSKAVYTYQIEDVLPDHGIEGGCHLYSATNPGAKRFDVFRVQTGNGDDKDQEQNPNHQSTKPWNELTIKCEVNRYTDLHTWFPGYSWCMMVCNHCNTHIGWGFSPVDPGDDLQSENNADDDHQEEDEEEEEVEENKQDEQQQDEEKKKKKKENKKVRPPRNIRAPTFVGIIFGHIRARTMPVSEWNAYLLHLSSVSVEYQLDLLRSAWPLLDDRFRTAILRRIFQIRQAFFEWSQKDDPYKFTPAFSFVMYFKNSLSSRDLHYSLLNAAAYIQRRKRRRADEGESSEALDAEEIRIPGFRSKLTQVEEEYLFTVPSEDEEYVMKLDDRELFAEYSALIGNPPEQEKSEPMMEGWRAILGRTENYEPRRIYSALIMIFSFFERWQDQYLLEDGRAKNNNDDENTTEQEEQNHQDDDAEEDLDWANDDDENEENEEHEEQEEREEEEHHENIDDEPAQENEIAFVVHHQEKITYIPRNPEIESKWKFFLVLMIPQLEFVFRS